MWAAFLWNFNRAPTRHIITGYRLFIGQKFLVSARMDDFTAVFARTWTNIDNPVGFPHRVFVMFHYDEGISHIA